MTGTMDGSRVEDGGTCRALLTGPLVVTPKATRDGYTFTGQRSSPRSSTAL
jgi:hypothetical protein